MIDFILKQGKNEVVIDYIHYVEGKKAEDSYFWGYIEEEDAPKIESGKDAYLSYSNYNYNYILKSYRFMINITEVEKNAGGYARVYFNFKGMSKNDKENLLFDIRSLYQSDD